MPHLRDAGWTRDQGLFRDADAPGPEPPVLEALVGQGIRPVSRILVLASLSGPILATFEGDAGVIVAGSVTSDRSRTVRRSGTVTLANPDGALTPRARGDLLDTGALVRIERGVRVGEAPDYLALATLVTRYQANMDGSLVLTGDDPLSLCAQSFGTEVVVPAGTAAEAALRILWEPVLGDGSGWPLDAGGRLMPLRVFLGDEDRLDAVIRYFKAQGLEVYADRLGRPLMRPEQDPATATAAAIVREFLPGSGSTLLTLERSGGRRPYNRVVVESTNPAGPAIRVELVVDDPASPLHPDRIGTQTAPTFRSAQVPDQATANAVARALLAEYAMAADGVSGSAVPDVTLEVGAVVWIEEAVSGTTGRHRLDRLTLPVTTGPMSLSAGKVLPLLLTGADAA